MSTMMSRYIQAHQHAMSMAEKAYHSTHTSQGDKWLAYSQTYNREMTAFYQLEAMRRPLANQSEIDAESAALLRGG